MIYMNDIFIMKKTKKEHRERIRKILRKLLKTKLRIKFFKSKFEKEEIKFLGYIVGRRDIKPDPKKIRILKEWPRSTRVKEVQNLMDFVNYYRKLTSRLSEIAYLLNQLLKKKRKWEWEQKKEESFEKIIRNISKENKIRFYNPEFSFIIETNTLNHITRTTFLQKEKSITFMSKIMNQTEQNYEIFEKEMLIII